VRGFPFFFLISFTHIRKICLSKSLCSPTEGVGKSDFNRPIEEKKGGELCKKAAE
jgi:hypothetical protein